MLLLSSIGLKQSNRAGFSITESIKTSLYFGFFIPLISLLLLGCNAEPSLSDDTSKTASTETTTLRIAAASNLAHTLPALIDAYQNKTTLVQKSTVENNNNNIDIEVTYGSSGKLYAQIMAGAPYDIYLAANQTYPAKLVDELSHLPQHSKPFTYARGQLALYRSQARVPVSSNPNRLENMSKTPYLTPEALQLLLGYNLEGHNAEKVAIANPDLAPYGAAARHYLQKNHLYQPLIDNYLLIQDENIGQVLQSVDVGGVAYGFVALSQLKALQVTNDSYRIIALSEYPPILQDGMVISDRPDAQAFADYLQSDSAQQQLQQAGYASFD